MNYDLLMNFVLSKSLKKLGYAFRSSSETKSSLFDKTNKKNTVQLLKYPLKVNSRPDKCKLKHKVLKIK